MKKEADQWDFWRKALTGVRPRFDVNAPQAGCYRMRQNMSQPWQAVMIFWDDHTGDLAALVGNQEINDLMEIKKLWRACYKRPIHSDVYADVVDHGAKWPDDISGDDGGIEEDKDCPRDQIGDRIDQLRIVAMAWLNKINPGVNENHSMSVKDQEQADKAINYANRFKLLWKRADKERTDEKAPFLKAERDVDALWRGPLTSSKLAASDMDRAVDRWSKREVARREAEAAAARELGEVVKVEPVRVGTEGRSRSLIEHTDVNIVSLLEVAMYFAQLNDPPMEFVQAVRICAVRYTRMNFTVPGVEVDKTKKLR